MLVFLGVASFASLVAGVQIADPVPSLCQRDVQKLCGGATGNAALQCLKGNEKFLRAGCMRMLSPEFQRKRDRLKASSKKAKANVSKSAKFAAVKK